MKTFPIAVFAAAMLLAAGASAQNYAPPDNAGKTITSEPTGGNQPPGGNPVPVAPGPAVPTITAPASDAPGAASTAPAASPASAAPVGGK